MQSSEKETDTSHGNFMCHVASELALWLTALEEGDDKLANVLCYVYLYGKIFVHVH
jgi:hypothetical protein